MRSRQLISRTALAAALLVLASGARASTQVATAGAERTFSGDGPDARVFSPAAAFLRDEAVLVWEGAEEGVVRQRLDATGEARGSRAGLAANDLPDRVPYRGLLTLQRDPEALALERNQFVSFWVEEVQRVDVDAVYQESEVLSSRVVARRFGRQGRPVGPLETVGGGTPGLESAPDAARLSDGRAVVVWQTTDGNGPNGVYGRLLSGHGVPRGEVFRIDGDGGGGGAWRPAVAAGPDAGFVVAWQGCCDGDGDAVFVRSFDGDGVPRGAGARVNATTDGLQIWPAIARGESGGYLVAWMSPGAPESGFIYQVHGRPLDASGAPMGPQTVLSRGGASAHGAPALAPATDGYLLLWTTWRGTLVTGVHAAAVSGRGIPRGEAVRVSTGPVATQWELALATDGEGRYLAAWQGFDEEGSPAIHVRPLALSTSPGRSADLAPGPE